MKQHKTGIKTPGASPDARKRILWISTPGIFVLIMLCLILWRGYARSVLQARDEADKKADVFPVKVMPVEHNTIPRYIKHSGVIHAWQQAVIFAEVGGKVKAISAKVGDVLEPGQQIVKLDDEMLTYGVDQARANALQLEATYETSKREFERKRSLFKNKVISDFEFDIARAKMKADRARYDGARAALKIAQRDLRETSVSSPIRGVLAECVVDLGTNIARGTRVATVVDIERVKITVGISEKNISNIRKDMPVRVYTDAYPGKTYSGSVYSVGTKADDRTLTFPVEIVLPNSQGPVLKPGMVARVEIQTAIYNNAVSLPQEAVLQEGARCFVWTLSGETAHRRPVDPVDIIGSRMIIAGDLAEGSLVVVSGQDLLVEGCDVSIIEDTKG